MGKEAFDKYVNQVYEVLLSMKPGKFLSIDENVKSENIDLFIKICCMFISEQSVSAEPSGFCHIFNDEFTEIKCNTYI